MDELIQMVAASLERAVNAALSLDPEARERLRGLEGQVLAVALQGLGTTLTVIPVAGRLTVAPAWDGEVDATISAPPLALLNLAVSGDNGLVRRGEVTIHGRVEVAQAFQGFFEQLNIDWEEHVARLVGDPLSHRLGGIVRGLGQWAGDWLDRGLQTSGEYLREEGHWLPSGPEVAVWRDDVATLRDDVARLEARLRLLEGRRATSRTGGDRT